MARKVALSLMAPVNQSTRGQRMFMKCKEKLQTDDDVTNSVNATPWKSPPPAPPLSLYSAASVIPLDKDDTAMSADEFERVRMFAQKSTHDTVAPQVCFSLANDLRHSNSKGGRMFAKRRAKAEQWTIENQPQQHQQPEKIMDKICTQYAMNQMLKMPPPASAARKGGGDAESPLVIPRLGDIPRARITPWDAAAEYGNIEPAFEHLTDLTFVGQTSSIPGWHNYCLYYQHSDLILVCAAADAPLAQSLAYVAYIIAIFIILDYYVYPNFRGKASFGVG